MTQLHQLQLHQPFWDVNKAVRLPKQGQSNFKLDFANSFVLEVSLAYFVKCAGSCKGFFRTTRLTPRHSSYCRKLSTNQIFAILLSYQEK